MALHIRDERAARLAKELAARRSVSMTQAVIDALESAITRDAKPLSTRLEEIAREAARLGDRERARQVEERDVDALWDNE